MFPNTATKDVSRDFSRTSSSALRSPSSPSKIFLVTLESFSRGACWRWDRSWGRGACFCACPCSTSNQSSSCSPSPANRHHKCRTIEEWIRRGEYKKGRGWVMRWRGEVHRNVLFEGLSHFVETNESVFGGSQLRLQVLNRISNLVHLLLKSEIKTTINISTAPFEKK